MPASDARNNRINVPSSTWPIGRGASATLHSTNHLTWAHAGIARKATARTASKLRARLAPTCDLTAKFQLSIDFVPASLSQTTLSTEDWELRTENCCPEC